MEPPGARGSSGATGAFPAHGGRRSLELVPCRIPVQKGSAALSWRALGSTSTSTRLCRDADS